MKKKIIIGIISFLLTIPINMTASFSEQFSLPISVFLIPFAIYFTVINKSNNSKILKTSIIFSFISLVIIAIINATSTLRPIGSMIFFFSPITVYFLGKTTITSRSDFIYLLRTSLYYSTTLAISLFISIYLFGNGYVREEGTFNGNYLGFPLSGSYGIHTLASHYFLLIFIALYFFLSGSANKFEKILIFITTIFYCWIIFFSLSREVVLAIIFVIFGTIFKLNGLKKGTIFSIIIMIIVLYNLDILFGSESAWATKVSQTVDAANLNDLSSGRLELQELAFNQILKSPLTGTGFHGYGLDYSSSTGYDSLEGWTTHIYYLTVIWKAGLFSSFFLLIFFINAISSSIRFTKNHFPLSGKIYPMMLFAFLVIINFLWDALLTTNVMCIFVYYLGAMHDYNKINRIKR